jgi:MSHA biogenesis protein MshM
MALAHELDIGLEPNASRHQMLMALNDCLLSHAESGRNVVVCIDEAQAIPLRTVESLRLLSNLETEKRKLIQLVLLGQPELDEKLALPQIRQLLQRITFSEYLGPMASDRVPAYLEFRLAAAALGEATDIKVFEESAARALAHSCAGVPRLINVLAHKCLMLAYGENEHRVTTTHVAVAVADTPGLVGITPWWKLWRRRKVDRLSVPVLVPPRRLANSDSKGDFW